jgi:hypothetical protein
VELAHPRPGKQLPQAWLGVGRFQQFLPYTPVISYGPPACFNGGVTRCILVHATSVHHNAGNRAASNPRTHARHRTPTTPWRRTADSSR